MTKLKVLDLFSGIGGFSLGLERTGGFETVAFCEIEEFPRRVLAKHWPDVPCYRDVRELTGERLAADGIAVDVICGGFPCQDISTAGSGAGLAGERSGLWSEIRRLASELRPSLIIVENVSALLSRGLGDVLGDLAAIGYNSQWHCIPATAVNAPHRRDRVWIVAYPNGEREQQQEGRKQDVRRWFSDGGQALENALRVGLEEQGRIRLGGSPETRSNRQANYAVDGGWWTTEPAVGRMAYGVPDRVDRLKGLGNAVVPQIPEMIGRAILASIEAERLAA